VFLTLVLFQINAKSPITLFYNKYSQKVIQLDKPIMLTQVVGTSIDNANTITWYKQPNVSIEYYNIYRNNISNSKSKSDWFCVGRVNYVEVPSFTDNITQYVENNIYDYRISFVDPCGKEVFADSIIQPICLMIEKTDNNKRLVWIPYRGMNVKKYYVLSGASESQMEIIDSINNTSYEVQRTTDYLFYQIKANGEIRNEITKKSEKVEVVSNKISPTLWVEKNRTDYNEILIRSNYSLKKSFVIFLGYCGKEYRTVIYDMSGQIVYNQFNNSEIFEINHNLFSKGIYVIQIESDGMKNSAKLRI